ncbi:hypothetical protein D3C80_812480 [compost metagenome]
MTQRGVIWKLLTCLSRVELYRLHHAIHVAFKDNTVVHNGGDFINNLWRSEAGVRNHSDTEQQRFPVLHTFSISINRKADCVVNQAHYRELRYGRMFERSIC